MSTAALSSSNNPEMGSEDTSTANSLLSRSQQDHYKHDFARKEYRMLVGAKLLRLQLTTSLDDVRSVARNTHKLPSDIVEKNAQLAQRDTR